MIRNFFKSILYFFLFIILINTLESLDYCEKNENGEEECRSHESFFSRKRYILYDVNQHEGFNLRRDVYIRIATFIKHLTKDNTNYEWNLVLPPWGNLYHWRSVDVGSQSQLPWGLFFDLKSLKKYIPVLELYEFINEYSLENDQTVLDQLYILKNDQEMFKTGNFRDKNVVSNCSKNEPYKNIDNNKYKSLFWGYKNITTNKINCITFHGTTMNLKKNLHPEIYRSVMFDHMEIPLHHSYGSKNFWMARRSMRYNSLLYQISNEFREKYLNSNDEADNTLKPEDWRLEKKYRKAIGGPYLAVHYRRQDFIIGHPESVPSISDAAVQIEEILKYLNLKTVFIATDAKKEEITLLKNKLNHYQVFQFEPVPAEPKLKDGQIAIIDQIICSHASYFIGTRESTFTMRIQEDREIMGLPVSTTFNELCVNKTKCYTENKWEIVWD